MENEKTPEQTLDELSKDPKALEEALNSELSAVGDNTTDQKQDVENDNQSGEGDKKPKTTADRFAEILSDRNEARKKAEEAEKEKNALAEKVAEMEATIATLKKAGEGDDQEKDQAATKNLSLDDVMELVNKRVSEVLSTKEQANLAEKSTADEISATAEKPEFAGIKGREDEIKGIMAKHPTLTAAAAYLLLVGIEKSQDTDDSNANKLGVGFRPNSDLLRDKKPAEMTTKELGDEISRLVSSGQLTF